MPGVRVGFIRNRCAASIAPLVTSLLQIQDPVINTTNMSSISHLTQSNGYRFPYGPVCVISPFNFPLEIPVLQLMGALFMGNKPVLKPAEKVSVVMEQFLRLLHDCGLPKEDVDLLNCEGAVAGELLNRAPVRVTQVS